MAEETWHAVGPVEITADVRASRLTASVEIARELRTFRIALSAPMGIKRGEGCGSSPTEAADAGVPTQLVSTVISSLDDVALIGHPGEASPPEWRPDPVKAAQAAGIGFDDTASSSMEQAEPGLTTPSESADCRTWTKR